MSLSQCDCGGFIPLGPDAANRCTTCGKIHWSPVAQSDHVAQSLMDHFQTFIALADGLGYRVEYKILKISKKDPT